MSFGWKPWSSVIYSLWKNEERSGFSDATSDFPKQATWCCYEVPHLRLFWGPRILTPVPRKKTNTCSPLVNWLKILLECANSFHFGYLVRIWDFTHDMNRMCTVCILVGSGGHLYTFFCCFCLIFIYWNEGSPNMFVKQIFLTVFHMQQEIIVQGTLCQTAAVQWMSVLRSGEFF